MNTSHLPIFQSCAFALFVGALDAQCGPTLTVHADISGLASSVTALADGRVAVGGWFQNGPANLSRVAIYDRATQSWDALAGGVDGTVQAVAQMPNGDLVVGGHFTSAGGVAVENIARWNGTAWSPISGGTSTSGANVWIYSLLVLPNGDLLVGGEFQEIEGTVVDNLARWDGTAWTSLGYPLIVPLSISVAPNGDLFVVDLFEIMRFSGGTWTFAGTFFGGYVNSGMTLADGSYVVAGHFSSIGNTTALNVARLQGGVWSPLGLGVDGTAAGLAELPDGDLIVTGDFVHANDAGGSTVVDGIARWDGQSWSAFGGGGHSIVQAITRNVDDSFSFAGYFPMGGGVGNKLASLTSACPAQAATFGLGCPGAAGTVALAAVTRPWLGSPYRARAAGLAVATIGLGVYGFAPAQLPLAPALPAGPACFLFSSIDATEVLLPTGGVVTTQLAIPNSATLIGATFRHQVLAVQIGVAGLAGVSASNGLLLTIGSL